MASPSGSQLTENMPRRFLKPRFCQLQRSKVRERPYHLSFRSRARAAAPAGSCLLVLGCVVGGRGDVPKMELQAPKPRQQTHLDTPCMCAVTKLARESCIFSPFWENEPSEFVGVVIWKSMGRVLVKVERDLGEIGDKQHSGYANISHAFI